MSAPEGIRFTKEQELAIRTTEANVLVSASAGTGKTAVLVERVIRLVTRPVEPVSLERILVLTFTEKAAEEMKSRIRDALENKVRTEPGDQWLLRQAALIEKAQISTIHSFCLRILRRYFYRIDLDPSFRVIDSNEAELVRLDALEDLMEDMYKQEESEQGRVFRELVRRYGGRGVDQGLQEICLDLHDYARTQPSMAGYLGKLRTMVGSVYETGSMWDLPWTEALLRKAAQEYAGAAELCRQALEIARSPEGPGAYEVAFQADLEFCQRARDILLSLPELEGQQEKMLQEIQRFEHPRLPAVRRGTCNENLKAKVQAIRKAVKDRLGKVSEYAFMRPAESVLQELRETAEYLECLIDLVLELDRRYIDKKRDRGGVDFSDLERYCLEVLASQDSLIASEVRKEFDYVLVDEYQDTNPVQERIISLCSRDGPDSNRFMVGDIKQSIYRFRLADPRIFLDKLRSYLPLEPEEEGGTRSSTGSEAGQETGPKTGNRIAGSTGDGLRIDLSRNFRSRSQVVDAVNFLFERIMKSQTAEIDYDEGHRLIAAAGYPQPSDDRFRAELHLLERNQSGEASSGGEDSIEDYEVLEREALVVAHKILEIMDPADPLRLWDGLRKGYRPCTYKDVAILLRSTKDRANAVMEILRRCGIPAYADTATGYFQAREVEVALSLLAVIDNPRQDIPLASVLRSPVVGLSPADLAIIRSRLKQGSFYDAVIAFAAGASGSSDQASARPAEIRSSLCSFLRRLETWRTMARRSRLEEVVWSIFRETSYYDYVGGLPGGAQRQANLRALCDRARQFDSFGYHGLFRFLRFIEKVQDSKGDLGTARALGEGEDVLRVMSVHKAKGLEFPVVFVMDLGKNFNLESSRGDVLFHSHLGIGALYCDLEKRIKYPSLAHQAISTQVRDENMAEEMRILYVALTRAREKLFLVGSVRDLDKHIDIWRELPGPTGSAMKYLDWLGPALLGGSGNAAPFSVTLWGTEQECPVPMPKIGAVSESDLKWSYVKDLQVPPLVDQELYQEISRRLEWKYPFCAASAASAKMSVGEIRRRFEDEEETFFVSRPYRRLELLDSEDRTTAVARGTAIHAFLAAMDLEHIGKTRSLTDELGRLCDLGLLKPGDISEEDLGLLARFLRSPAGLRLTDCPAQVKREVPFTLRVDPGSLYPERAFEDDFVVVQGIIDAIIFEDDGVILLDYKSDRISPEQVPTALRNYTPQVSMYALACRRILKRPVKQASVVFLVPDLEAPVPWEQYLSSRGLIP